MLMGCSRGLLTLINNISIHASEKAKVLLDCSALSEYNADHEITIDTKIPTFNPGRDSILCKSVIRY